MYVVGITVDNMVIISQIESEIIDIKDKYLSKVNEIIVKHEENNGDIKIFLTEYFDETNIYRKNCSSCLNKIENLYTSSFRQGPFSKNPEIKKIIFTDYFQGKKSFADQDQYLKKKIADVLHANRKE